jgi:cell division septal protein FtsQ
MKRQRINLTIKVAAGAIIVFAISVSIAAYLWHSFKQLDYFKIKDIVTSENNLIDLSYLKGQYIFSVNLEKQAYYLSQLYPVYSKIRLVRILPNRIYVDFVRRKAVAYIKLYKYFCVDTDAVLFDVPVQQETQDLPVIVGLETKIFGPKSGKKFNVKELALALDIIKEAQVSRLLRFNRIKKIDVSNPANASVFLQGQFKNKDLGGQDASVEAVEVKIGQANIRDKINILASLFIQLKKDWFNIRYIDLRFKEPVVKFKDKDAKK